MDWWTVSRLVTEYWNSVFESNKNTFGNRVFESNKNTFENRVFESNRIPVKVFDSEYSNNGKIEYWTLRNK